KVEEDEPVILFQPPAAVDRTEQDKDFEDEDDKEVGATPPAGTGAPDPSDRASLTVGNQASGRTAEEEPTADEEPMTEEPTVEEEPTVREEPMVRDEPIVLDELMIEDELTGPNELIRNVTYPSRENVTPMLSPPNEALSANNRDLPPISDAASP